MEPQPQLSVRMTALDPATGLPAARVGLNGHRIPAGGPLGRSGVMVSFVLLEGSLERYWEHQTAIVLRSESGREALFRVAALPVEEGEIGFLEIV